jgi:chromosome segregation ATPase
MTNKLTDARKSLERAKEAALIRLHQLDEERKEIKASIKSLDAALKALKKPVRLKKVAERPSSNDLR